MNRILLGATALMMTLPAIAQVPTPPAPPIAPRVDMTQTRDQAVAKVREHFAMMDTNRDGFIAGDEMQSMRGQHRGAGMGERRGRGGDRMGNPTAAFDRLDVNRDNMISRDEFAKGRELRIERQMVINGAPGAAGEHAEMAGKHGMAGKHDMAGMHGKGDHHAMGGREMGKRMGGGGHGMSGHGGLMRMADVDKDGRVSLQEATASALQRFDRIDANRDGRITLEERQQQREQRKQRRDQRAG